MSVLAGIREPTPAVRVCADWLGLIGPDASRRWAIVGRRLGLAAIFAAFVAVSGAFGTGRISPDVRYPIVEFAALAVALGDLALGAALDHFRWLATRRRRRLVAGAMLGTIWAMLFCWSLAFLFEGPQGAPSILLFLPPIMVGYGTVGAVALLLRGPAAAPKSRAGRPSFLERLPHRLRGAALIAVQGEDHYVRIHTSQGQHLLLMRLSDALDELETLDGGQTHRSWWVARSAVVGVRRGNGRAVMTLSNGIDAPVSRRFSPWLRRNRWF